MFIIAPTHGFLTAALVPVPPFAALLVAPCCVVCSY